MLITRGLDGTRMYSGVHEARMWKWQSQMDVVTSKTHTLFHNLIELKYDK